MFEALKARLLKLQDSMEKLVSFRWAIVTQGNPLRIRFEDSTTALPFTPSTLVSHLITGDRVAVLNWLNHVVIIGLARQEQPRRFATKALLNDWDPPNGTLAYVVDEAALYMRYGGTWRIALLERMHRNLANGRSYFGSGVGATGAGFTYIAFSNEGDTGTNSAAWITYDGVQLQRWSKNGDSAFNGSLSVGGTLTAGGRSLSEDTGWVNIPLASGFASRPGDYRMQCRRIGGIVYIRGHMDLTKGNWSGNPTFATLPVGFRPSMEYRWMGFRTGQSHAPFGGWVATNGSLTFQTNANAADPSSTHFSPIITPFPIG